jgi:hypothetical protein
MSHTVFSRLEKTVKDTRTPQSLHAMRRSRPPQVVPSQVTLVKAVEERPKMKEKREVMLLSSSLTSLVLRQSL